VNSTVKTVGERASGVPKRIVLLAAGTFAVGTDVFVVNGVLSDIAGSLRVDIAAAGQLVTVFAIAYAIGSPIVATLAGSWPRRTVLLTGLGILVLGNILTALAPTYPLALVARVVAALGAGMFTPSAGATAAALAPERLRGRAMSIVTLGLVGSTALGVPLGTLLGTVLDWRETMWFVAVLGVLAAVGIAVGLPEVPSAPAARLRARLVPLRDIGVVGLLTTTLLLFTAIYLVNVYISVILGQATGGRGTVLTLLLFACGVAGVIGNLLSGRWTDRFGARRVLLVVSVIGCVNFTLMPVVATSIAGAAVSVVVYGASCWCVMVPQQHRLIGRMPSAAALVVSLNASATYAAVALAGVSGAAAMRVMPPIDLPWLAAGLVVAGMAASELASKLARPAEVIDPPVR
jgi:predicted MFS family arabinose efflux permease